MEAEQIQSQASPVNPSDMGLRITIKLQGKTVSDSVIMMIPAKAELEAFIKNIVDLQCKDIISKLP